VSEHVCVWVCVFSTVCSGFGSVCVQQVSLCWVCVCVCVFVGQFGVGFYRLSVCACVCMEHFELGLVE
jgi:hypothetical protein